MLITKTPFRVSFCGGGSDVEDFYLKNGGCVISTTINKYMYISIHPYFDANYTMLKYSKNELVDDTSKIEHGILKTVLEGMDVQGVEITSTADIPAGTGLGSSSTFTVGLLNTLYSYKGKFVSKARLAYEACDIEINKLGEPIGKQDQYAAAFGGLNFIKFNRDSTVSVSPILMLPETYKKLQKNLLMFYTGVTRSASLILKEQKKNISNTDKSKNLMRMCELTYEMKNALENNDLTEFGRIMNESWVLKKTLATEISNPEIDKYYKIAIENGATGGKLLGAGGGGFLLFYCEEEHQEKVREQIGLKEMEFSFEHDGTSVIYIGDKYWD